MRTPSSFLLASAFALIFQSSTTAQGLVTQSPRPRTVLFEQYAAIQCGNCPAANVLVNGYQAADPGAIVDVKIHGSVAATPGPGQIDLRCMWSDSLLSFFDVMSQPRGCVNRLPVNGQYTNSYPSWSGAIAAQRALPSPVNIGVASTFDAQTRELTVQVELFWTANSPGTDDRISVFLMENNIVTWQQDYVNGPQPNYAHQHVLRDYITDGWGDAVPAGTQGASVTRTYSYTVPAGWDAAQCEVAAYVGEYQGEVYQAVAVAAQGGTTTGLFESAGSINVAAPYPSPAHDQVVVPLANTTTVVRISDVAGRLVATERVASAQRALLLDVNDWPDGLYLIRQEGAGSVQTTRLLVQH